MKSVLPRAICFAVLIPSFGSCGSSHGSNSTASGQQRSCPAFESSDAGSTCTKAAGFIFCGDPSGAVCECLSNDLTNCSEPITCNLGDGYGCTDVCAATEYAVACRGPVGGEPLNLEPTGGCRFVAGVPGGGISGAGTYCCPCELARTTVP